MGGKVWARAAGGIKGGCTRIMRIRLNFQDRFTEVYEVEPGSTVLALKQRISVIIGIPTHQFWFSTELRILENEETFEHAGIIDGEELDVEGVIDRVVPVYAHVPAYLLLPGSGGRGLHRPATLGLLLLGTVALRLQVLPMAERGPLVNLVLILLPLALAFLLGSVAGLSLRAGIFRCIVVRRQVVQAREQRRHFLHAGVRGVFYMNVSQC
jgi:hypothetical protein